MVLSAVSGNACAINLPTMLPMLTMSNVSTVSIDGISLPNIAE